MRIKTKNKNKYLLLAIFTAIFVFRFDQVHAAEITPAIVIELTNYDRKQHGLTVLRENKELSLAAKEKAQDMISNNYFAHTSPQGFSPWYWIEKNGYDFRFAGENLAIHFSDPISQQQAWMKSESHRKNILKGEYSEIGVAVVRGIIDGKQTTITVQMFGKKMNETMNSNQAMVAGSQKEVILIDDGDAFGKKYSLPLLSLGMSLALLIVCVDTLVIIQRKRQRIFSSI